MFALRPKDGASFEVTTLKVFLVCNTPPHSLCIDTFRVCPSEKLGNVSKILAFFVTGLVVEIIGDVLLSSPGVLQYPAPFFVPGVCYILPPTRFRIIMLERCR